MKKGYALHPGYVYSQFDAERHFISGHQLAKLYKVPWIDCVLWIEPHCLGLKKKDYTHLFPQNNGDYNFCNSVSELGAVKGLFEELGE